MFKLVRLTDTTKLVQVKEMPEIGINCVIDDTCLAGVIACGPVLGRDY